MRTADTTASGLPSQADLASEADRHLHEVGAVPPRTADAQTTGAALADGTAGIALAHIERARAGFESWHRAHQWICAAAAAPVSDHDTAGLFFGAPALAFVLDAAAGSTDRYQGGLADLDAAVARLAHRRAAQALARIRAGRLASFAEYDVFGGLTGLGALLLRRAPTGSATEQVLTALVALTRPLTVDGETLPGWWVDHDPHRRQTLAFRGGHGNLGAAHGITGPLTLLSLAARNGTVVDGQLDAIATVCDWLDAWQQDCAAGPWWPEHLALDELRTGRCAQPRSARPSWCYGTPGITRAGQLAALALGDRHRQAAYEQALLACLDDPTQQARLVDPGLCHGQAGLFQTVWRAATDATTGDLRARLPALAARLLRTARTADQADPGFLTGGAGIALALHTAATNTAPRSGWDTCLLIN
ncbi:lanthionine synthetase C family protein [Frankia sp. AgB1.9]|uniref:lanthionine synthetase C family protein n=1 Tax=unclassified Frankia TaxID=2632575 RepID=UPI001932EF13|nr:MULTISPECIES: lanthionine synthetase C family protein [unclassified Frankia]MBL7487326.1 lanthionine synthetase C family protein [Frankia sp. AgW1.1]MBL7546334.1 lanthionine synthetase C family protein [Frankia sp. AgB1.9]MBL7618620.1 lanthionine synthetase C family protein [Frankia sp. AgB1.8]